MRATDDDLKRTAELAGEALEELRKMGDLAFTIGSLYDWAVERSLDPNIVERLNEALNAVNKLGGYCDCGGSSNGPCRSGSAYAVQDLIAATGLQLPGADRNQGHEPRSY